MESELRHDTEWSLIDDGVLSYKPGNWKDVVRECVSAGVQPTILLYEYLTEDDSTYKSTAEEYKFDRLEVSKLISLSNQISSLECSDVNTQKLIMKQIQRE